MNTICLVIDRLHVGYLGPYGNAWIATPALNRLAAEGFTFDGAFIESTAIEDFCDACWLGRHAMGPRGAIEPGRGLPALLSARSVATRLLTDDPVVASHPLAASFGEIVELELPMPGRPAEAVEDTLLGQCFAQLLESLDSVRGPFFQWCHLDALATAWDAPADLRRLDWDEGDPEPPQTVAVPSKRLSERYDPDELLGYSQVYAAQVCVLDACLAVLHDWLLASPAGRETLLMVTSSRGFPLGEHLGVGGIDDALYPELVQVPLILRFPDLFGASDRSAALVQPSDLAKTLAEWHAVAEAETFGGASIIPIIRGDRDVVRQCIGAAGREGDRALVTPAWYLRHANRPELFLRPDDRWCANDVADRCPHIVEGLSTALSEYRQAAHASQIDAFPPLAAELLIAPE